MAQISTIYHWGVNNNITPCLVGAANYYGIHVSSVTACLQEHWVLDLSFSSYGKYRVGSSRARWHERTPLSLHLYPPGTHYWEDTTNESGKRHSAWLLFDCGKKTELKKLILGNQKYARFQDTDSIVGDMICKVASIGQEEGHAGFWKAQAVFCQIIHTLVNAEHAGNENYRIQSVAQTHQTDFVTEVNNILRQHLDVGISLAELAASLHISTSALSHRYRKETNIPPMTAFQQMRIETAKVFLLRGFPLKTIAYDLGFSDEFHLSKAFKRVTGLAPKHYLNSKKAGS